ncbi:MAG TPA: YihY/virulence factor BrkB family protein [Bacteroidia bacterium]|jgi:membrane protein
MATSKNRFADLWQITKKTSVSWYNSDPFRQAAVISYYAIFSIPALLVIVITTAGFFFGEEAVSGAISGQISSVMGNETAQQIEDIVAKSSQTQTSIIATIIGIITLILGATGVFVQLQKSLDLIWEVEPKAEKALLKSLKDRLFSFGLIMSIGFLLLISLLISAGLSVLSEWIRGIMPDVMMVLFRVLSFVISFGVVTVLFALMFRILPDVKIRWRDVWLGAMITSLLFVAGKFLLGLYFGKADPGSAYGAAGSIILIMLWVNYSSMIVFYGAEFTKQYALHHGREIEPKRDAVVIRATEAEKQIAEKRHGVKGVELGGSH